MASEKDIKAFTATFMDIAENIQKVVPLHETDIRKFVLLKGIRDYEVHNRKHITISDISKASGMALPNVSRYLKPFEEAGYIGREKNGRIVSIFLTAKGNSFLAGHMLDTIKDFTLLLNSYPEEDLPELLSQCQKFSETIHKLADRKTGENNVQDLQKPETV